MRFVTAALVAIAFSGCTSTSPTTTIQPTQLPATTTKADTTGAVTTSATTSTAAGSTTSGGSSATTTSGSSATTTSGSSATTTSGSSATSTTTVTPTGESTTLSPLACPIGDQYCQVESGDPASYCKYWQAEEGGVFSVCQGTDIKCSCEQPTQPPPTCNYGDEFCRHTVDSSSYCKFYQAGPEGSLCQGSDVICECTAPSTTSAPTHGSTTSPAVTSTLAPGQCPTGDEFCKHETHDEGSYCKFWQTGEGALSSVCQGTEIQCSCDVSTSPPEHCHIGDDYCRETSGLASYCKFYQNGPGGSVCQGSDMPCMCEANLLL